MASVKIAKSGGSVTEEVVLGYTRLLEGVQSLSDADTPLAPARFCFDWATKVSCGGLQTEPPAAAGVAGVVGAQVLEAVLSVEKLVAPEDQRPGVPEPNVSSFSTSVQAPVGGAAPTKSLALVKPIDSDSPAIYGAAARGVHHPTATIVIRGLVGDVLKTFATVRLTDVVVASDDAAGSPEGGHIETVFLRYQTFELTVARQRACFDFVLVKAC